MPRGLGVSGGADVWLGRVSGRMHFSRIYASNKCSHFSTAPPSSWGESRTAACQPMLLSTPAFRSGKSTPCGSCLATRSGTAHPTQLGPTDRCFGAYPRRPTPHSHMSWPFFVIHIVTIPRSRAITSSLTLPQRTRPDAPRQRTHTSAAQIQYASYALHKLLPYSVRSFI